MMTPERAWTLGYPPSYDKAVRMPGNGKAPGGYAFRTREEAEAYSREWPEAIRLAPYEILLPDAFDLCTTEDWWVAEGARHEWHIRSWGRDVPMDACAICNPIPDVAPPHARLIVSAEFINPDTGEVA